MTPKTAPSNGHCAICATHVSTLLLLILSHPATMSFLTRRMSGSPYVALTMSTLLLDGRHQLMTASLPALTTKKAALAGIAVSQGSAFICAMLV
jgi:hypothetical protein